jgi:putative oxidoreductase
MNTIRNAVWRAYELLITVANFLQSPFLLALRLYFFWQLFQTGQGKLSNITKIISFFRDLHIPAPTVNAYFVSSLECFGGLLLMIGLASRPLALMVAISMCVAYWTTEQEALTTFFSNSDNFVKAAPFPYLLTALIVLVFGPGLYSIDALLKRWVVGTASVPSDSSAGRLFRQRDR